MAYPKVYEPRQSQAREGYQNRDWQRYTGGYYQPGNDLQSMLSQIQRANNQGGRPSGTGGSGSRTAQPGISMFTPSQINTPDAFTNPLTNWNPATVDPEQAIRALEPVYRQRIKEGMAEAGAQAGKTGMAISSSYVQRLGREEAKGTNEWQMAHEGLVYDASKFNREQELQKMLAQANLDFESWAKSGDWSMEGQMFSEGQRFAAHEGHQNRLVDIFGINTQADTERYGIDVNASTDRYGIDVGAATNAAGMNADARRQQIQDAFNYARTYGVSFAEAMDAIGGAYTGGPIPGPQRRNNSNSNTSRDTRDRTTTDESEPRSEPSGPEDTEGADPPSTGNPSGQNSSRPPSPYRPIPPPPSGAAGSPLPIGQTTTYGTSTGTTPRSSSMSRTPRSSRGYNRNARTNTQNLLMRLLG